MELSGLFKEATSHHLTSDQDFLDIMRLQFIDSIREMLPNRNSTACEPSLASIPFCLKIMASNSPKRFAEAIDEMGSLDRAYDSFDTAQRDYRLYIEHLANNVIASLNISDKEFVTSVLRHYSMEACNVVVRVMSFFGENSSQIVKEYTHTFGDQLLKEQELHRLAKQLKREKKKLNAQIQEASNKSYFDEEDLFREKLKILENRLIDINAQISSLKKDSVRHDYQCASHGDKSIDPINNQIKSSFDNNNDVYRSHTTKVVGVTFNNSDGINRQNILNKLNKGSNLELVRDHENTYDKYAIKIMSELGCIGHLSRDEAFKFSHNNIILGDCHIVSMKLVADEKLGCLIEFKYYDGEELLQLNNSRIKNNESKHSVKGARHAFVTEKNNQQIPVKKLENTKTITREKSVYPFTLFHNLSDEQIIKTIDQPFHDKTNFPYGFNRSGEFSLDKAEILKNKGRRLVAVQLGIIVPNSDDEHSFKEFVSGNKKASNTMEETWNKYLDIVKAPTFKMFSVNPSKGISQSEHEPETNNHESEINDYEPPNFDDDNDSDIDYGYKDDEDYC